MKTITIDNITYTIEEKSTHIGDTIVDLNSNTIYEATIADADDINWIVIDSTSGDSPQDSNKQHSLEDSLISLGLKANTINIILSFLTNNSHIAVPGGAIDIDQQHGLYQHLHRAYTTPTISTILGESGIYILPIGSLTNSPQGHIYKLILA